MSQLSLFDDAAPAPLRRIETIAPSPSVLTCEYGEPWIGPHPLCHAEMARDHLEWLKLVEAGVYDAEGYTPNERKAQQRKVRGA